MNNKICIFDGHNDTLKQIYLTGRDFLTESEKGNVDLPRAKIGCMRGGIFAIQVPPENIEERKFGYGLTLTEKTWEVVYPKKLNQKYAVSFTNNVIKNTYAIERKSQEMKIVCNFNELVACIKNKILAVVLHFEGAEAICPELENLEDYYQKGLRSLGIVWSRPNDFGYGVPFKFPCHPDIGLGLTESGKKLVKKCNELGILIDLTHINLKGFYDVAEISTAPLVASHANVHAICPSTCNLLNEQILAIGKSNGIIGINFDVINLRPDGRAILDTPLEIIAQHISYIAEKIGIDHVGLGSDFDGAQLPSDLKNVAQLRQLIDTLRAYGFNDDDLKKITHQNWLRVIKATWK